MPDGPKSRPRDTNELAHRVFLESIGEAPKVIHKLSSNQTEALRAALKDLGDARKLLEPVS